MIVHRKFYLLAVIVGLMVTACAPQAIATSNPTAAPVASAVPATAAVPDKPITLHLAVSDFQGQFSEPDVQEFVDQVNTLSKGNIAVVAVWDAGGDVTPPIEEGVIKVVKDGKYELGLAGSRAWDRAGVTSFQALQAPFLITDDALANAVASSEIGTRMLEGLSAAGITGLGLWPEGLRHPFSYVSGKSILSPDDLKGLAIRTPSSEVSFMLMKAFGGKPFFDNETQGFPAAEAGMLGGVSSAFPTVTGNVTYFPKFQTLFANGTAFEKLSEGQRSILRQAAVAAQKKAIAEHPSEADAARAFCDHGGTIVMASQEQVAAFEAAAKPVFDEIDKDPLNAELITAIRELKTKTQPAPGAEACQPAPSSEVWSTGLPPNGKWTVNLTMEDVIAKGVSRSTAAGWAGQFLFEFQDGQGHLSVNYLDGTIAECPFTYKAVEDFFRNTYVDLGQPHYLCGPEVDDLQWRLDEQGQLHLHVINLQGPPFMETKADFEAKPWQKVVNP